MAAAAGVAEAAKAKKPMSAKETIRMRSDYEDYTQIYVILRAIGSQRGQSTQREVLFRYGNWCYSGHIELGSTRLNKEDLPTVVPILQLQQGNLKYMCPAKEVPRGSRFLMPLIKTTEVSQALGDSITGAIEELAALARANAKEYGWVGEDNNNLYFELQTDGRHQGEDIEMIASKTVVRGVQMVIIYFAGSYYCQVSDAAGDHSLLNTRFPDVSCQSRGYQIKSTAPKGHEHFRLLTLYQGGAPPQIGLIRDMARGSPKDEAAGDAAAASAAGAAESMEEEPNASAAQGAAVAAAASTAAKPKVAKVAKEKTAKEAAAERKAAAKAAPVDVMPLHVPAEFAVRAPHHLAPMGGSRGGSTPGLLKGLSGKLPQLPKGLTLGAMGPAPWDKGGRPLALGKK